MGFLESFLLIGSIHLLAAMSPGPDFVLVTKETLTKGKRAGFLCSLGITLGLSVHIVYSALGLAAVIASSASLLMAIKIIGGLYLIYLGISSIKSAKKEQNIQQNSFTCKQSSDFEILRNGFLCNVFNPKAPLYFVSLFTVVISPALPLYKLAIYGIWIMFIQLFWFGFIAYVLSAPAVQKKFFKLNKWINYLLGGAMIALGVKVLSSRT